MVWGGQTPQNAPLLGGGDGKEDSGICLRYYMLILFMWTGAVQASSWSPLTAAPGPAKISFPKLSEHDIILLLNLGPIVQLFLTPYVPAA